MKGTPSVGAAEGCEGLEGDEPDTARFAACGSSYRQRLQGSPQANDESFK
jgi:hypothetical protein